MKFDAVIFDLDGTLLDTLDDIAAAANSVLAAVDKPTYPAAAYKELVGDGLAMLFQRAIPECERRMELKEECMRRFEAAYLDCWNNRSKPYDGIHDLLRILNERSVSISVLSNKADVFTKLCVQHYFADIRFAHILGQSDVFPRKPDPSSARWLTKKLAVNVDRIAYVGDTNTDMKTAVGAGVYAIGVTWGFRPKSELLAAGAKQICNDVSQLTELLLNSGRKA